jgi:uncharacterized protein
MKGKQILGIDPAFRTGCKLAVINPFGTFVAKGVMYPHPPVNKKEDAEKIFVDFVKTYDVELIAIGNGTASRETEQFVASMIQEHQLNVQFIIVNEAGASTYRNSTTLLNLKIWEFISCHFRCRVYRCPRFINNDFDR